MDQGPEAMDTTLPQGAQFANPYGYFDPVAREYVITRPDTPTPWINYLGAGRYGGIISNTAGGYSFDRDPRNRRVTRYRYNGIPVDQPGRYVYLRDQESGDYWSPTWQPVVERRLEAYECRHGPGYTRICGTYAGIAASLLYFVPDGEKEVACPCEAWVLRLRNESSRPRTLRAFSYVEFSFCDAVVDQQNMDWGMHIVHSVQREGAILVSTHARPATSFFSSNAPIAGFDTDRETFLGRYRDLGNPEVVERGRPANEESPRGNSIGSLCHELVLAPGEEKEIIYLLGVTDEPEQIAPVLARYRDPGNVEAAFQSLRADWDTYLSCFTVATPDPGMNAMLSLWNPLQCRTTLCWSRFVSAYESGLGRGLGTRDTAQDALATVQAMPAEVRRRLSKVWALQFQDGHTWHQFFPLTGEGGPGLAGEIPEWPQWFCDDSLWLIIATCAYLRETGDLAYLEQRVPYWDNGEDTVWSHILRAVSFTLEHRGPHGLPRLGFADWDDTMNLDHGSGKAESVWCGQQFCRAMLDLVDLCTHVGRTGEAEHFRGLHREMADVIQRTAWDGAWYARAYDDEGRPVGVRGEECQRIALNPQTWAVIGEIGDRARAEQAMQSAQEMLNTPFGFAMLWPAYRTASTRVLGTTTYPPGAKENGGIFCHAHAWSIVAAAMLGWNERAFEYYRQILPLARADVDHYGAEPYVYCQNICGPEHPQFGHGRNSWLTGTASWAYVAGTQWILGIRPTFAGLQIAPVIPPDWPGFSARRVFRGVVYSIEVRRAGPGNAVSLEVDGRLVQGSVVPFPPARQREVTVRATLS
jgi:cellobiose phosphorylase